MSKETAIAAANPTPQAPVNPNPGANPPQETPKPSLDSERFASLARKEAEFVKRQQAFKAEQEQYAELKKQADEILGKGKLFDETRGKDPIAALKLIGFSEQEIFKYLEAAKDPTPEEKAAAAAEAAAQRKFDEFRAQEEEKAKKAKEESDKVQKEQDNRSLEEYRAGLQGFINLNKDKYEYCAHYGTIAVDLAYRTTLQIVRDSKGEDIPTPEEVIQQIEEFYEEQDKSLMGLKKRQSFAQPQGEPERQTQTTRSQSPEARAGSLERPVQRARPLSNAARPTTTALARTVPETRDQKRARIIEAIRARGLTK